MSKHFSRKIKHFIKKHKKKILIASGVVTILSLITIYISNKNKQHNSPMPFKQLKNNKNKNLAGKRHPKTGVPYKKEAFIANGNSSEGTFPQFKGIRQKLNISVADYYEKLRKDYPGKDDKWYDKMFYEKTMGDGLELIRKKVFRSSVHKLFYKIKYNLSNEQLNSLYKGRLPQGKLMHHEYYTIGDCMVMQMVDKDIHSKSDHTGGSYTCNPNNYKN